MESLTAVTALDRSSGPNPVSVCLQSDRANAMLAAGYQGLGTVMHPNAQLDRPGPRYTDPYWCGVASDTESAFQGLPRWLPGINAWWWCCRGTATAVLRTAVSIVGPHLRPGERSVAERVLA